MAWQCAQANVSFIRAESRTTASRSALSRCVSRTAALWPTYNPQDRKVGATCDSTPFFGKYNIAEWVGCARAVTSTGDFVRFKRDNQALFGRVDHIFVLDNDKDRRIFTVLTLIKRTKTCCVGRAEQLRATTWCLLVLLSYVKGGKSPPGRCRSEVGLPGVLGPSGPHNTPPQAACHPRNEAIASLLFLYT
jgi:hypothetical protein